MLSSEWVCISMQLTPHLVGQLLLLFVYRGRAKASRKRATTNRGRDEGRAEASWSRVWVCWEIQLWLKFGGIFGAGERTTTEVSLKTDNSASSVERLRKENEVLKKRLQEGSFSVAMLQGNDEMMKFYTGLLTWCVFLHLFCFLSPFCALPVACALKTNCPWT